jgi:maltooligosyltrehalose trehalohydrolase
MTRWKPKLGATVLERGVWFRVWAPEAAIVSVVREGHEDFPMGKSPEGYFSATIEGCSAGDLYRFRVDDRGLFPDPASRCQPQGVHGPSQVIDPAGFKWSDPNWSGIAREDLVLYELHIGTFTSTGTFQSAKAMLPALRDLGITAVELMPVADFAGAHNWGYDGVALFAPARCYGTPDDLRGFVDTAHRIGLAVFLDVVYNHFGPDGAYHSIFSPYYFSQNHRSPWGSSVNFDGPNSGPVRNFFVENALHWIHEYHFDGLRLDATHAIVDESREHIVASIASAIRASPAEAPRRACIIAEDVGNLAHMVKPREDHGWGLDAVWSDDFHHQLRRALAGDRDGYFRDFDGSARSISETAKKGWFYSGQYATYFGRARGSDPTGLEYSSFVFFIQNHDQIGNRAFGDRLHHKISLPEYRAASVLLLVLPEIPLLFMGQEWAASTPFLYFTNHHPELGRLVTEGRKREFERFEAFADPQTRALIPDPQDAATFEASRLNWAEKAKEPHASILRLYQALLGLRKSRPAFRSSGRSGGLHMNACRDDGLIVRREVPGQEAVLAVIQLRGEGAIDFSLHPPVESGGPWELLLSTEDCLFAPDPMAPRIDLSSSVIHFSRPGSVLLRSARRNLT